MKRRLEMEEFVENKWRETTGAIKVNDVRND